MNTAFRVAARTGLLAGFLLTGPLSQAQTAPPPTAPAVPAAPPELPKPADSPATPSPAAAPSATVPPAGAETPNAVSAATPAAQPAPEQPEPAPLPPRAAVDSLSNGDTRQALDLVRANYVNSAALTEDAVNRATLQGVLERLGPGVSIESPNAAPPADRPLRAEILDDRIGYIRLGSLTRDRLAEFDATLGNFAEKKLGSLILDLRSTPGSSDFELAAEFLKRLTPKGKMLFAVRRPSAKQEQMFTSSQDPAFEGVVVTIVNHKTAGAGEVIAAVLRTLRNALVIGQETAGEAAEFAVLPLRGGKLLRVAVAEVKLPGDLAIFPEGLEPDVKVEVPAGREAEVLQAGLERGVSGLVFETERVRLNEAALVAGVNPEWDEVEAAQKDRKNPKKTAALSDAALQRAVDLITTITIFKATK